MLYFQRVLDFIKSVTKDSSTSRSKDELLPQNILDEAYALIGNVEGRKLDSQQMSCILKEAHNHLVIAGAGTGKTTTIVGKIKYLLMSGKCQAEDILVLSFTNASATEMGERINTETGANIAAATFHKLGLSLLAKAEGRKPKITHIELRSFLRETLSEKLKDKAYMRLLSNYMLYFKVPSKSEFDFTTQNEYEEYLKLNPPRTFLGELVKSYGEMDIANFLYQHGIKYQYEAEYKADTRTEEYGQYYPDFYLPDYDLYIEYFGINRKGDVPSWFSAKHGLSAKAAYQQSMDWKFKTHKENNTVLLPLYAYEKAEGILFDTLEKLLSASGVPLIEKSPEEIWAGLEKQNRSFADGLIELFETAINLLKSNNYTIEKFRSLTISKPQRIFVDLIAPLYNAYDKALAANSEIDFNDMINRATEALRNGLVQNHYSYVIVDEYQDISKARYNLLSELRKSHDFNLFCVGDDWQSIYRFAGSDINYILNFERYWGDTVISRIETTYRFTDSLIRISGTFITQNPTQIKKHIKGNSADKRFSLGQISGYNEKFAVDFMLAKLEDLPQDSSVFFIGRYAFDIDMIRNCPSLSCSYNNVTGLIDVKYTQRSDLKMCFLTAHKSKGLQADYVFILNNKNSRMGFPSKIQDDPILELLLDNYETFPYAEERRLYYVALTRAKKKAFFLTEKGRESEFAQELYNRYKEALKKEPYECPLCGGNLIQISGKYGDFWGCENYKTLGCNYTRKIRHKETEKANSSPPQ